MSEPIAVLLDASALSERNGSNGIQRYVYEILAALNRRSDVHPAGLCFSPADLPESVEPVRVHRVARRILADRPRAQIIEHAIRLPVDLRVHRDRRAVFHNPSFHAPAGIRSPWVQTLHDVIPLIFDAPDQTALRARWRRFGPRYRHADAIIADSDYSAKEGVRLLGIEPERVHVSPLGVGPQFVPGPGGRALYGARPYVLVVSQYSQRKGFQEAFAVLDNLADAGYPHRLAVAGKIPPWGAEQLHLLRASTRHAARIDLLDYVEDLVDLYQGAACFLMTSRYEGFGLPPLEAMACGVPVVAFRNSAITEVVAEGGLLVPDGDVDAMTKAVRTVLDTPALTSELAERGPARASRFTWDAAASIHRDAYLYAADRAGNG